MEQLKPIIALLRTWLPVLITILIGIVVVWAAYRLLVKRQKPASGSRISRQLLAAALAGVFLIMVILELGDFSITYQAAGFLEEVKYLISAESELRECMLDSLHRASIEIVSPTFMNQRQLTLETRFIPRVNRAAKSPAAADESRPEERMFDKADLAEKEGKAEEQLKDVIKELEKLRRNEIEDADPDTSKARIDELDIRRAELESETEQHKEQKKNEEAPDEEA